VSSAPLAIEARDLEKTFRIPTHRVDSLKERVVRPFATKDERVLKALDGISFDIYQGEFFGIVGRNGSGKSTLLKLLASIYRADAGRIRMAGRLAPFIELGVGFNLELTARENVILNGVMMGLTPREARERLGAAIEFAELEEFIDLKLKNYSSGMLIRLAFSVMLQADADVLLVDEVLAVGDASFQQKCADAFHEMKASGKTIILVTHEMSTVHTYCDRAMLINGGKIQHLGDPDEVGRQYLRLNFEKAADPAALAAAQGSQEVQLLAAWIEDDEGNHQKNCEHGGTLRMRVKLKVLRETSGLDVGFIVADADGVAVFQFGTEVTDENGRLLTLVPGTEVTVRADVENLLLPGRYFAHCGVSHVEDRSAALYVHDAFDFVVFGSHPNTHGFVDLPHQIGASVEVAQPR
jgi:ABC-type polysaccharide/polyol phosphate transport system ATPase subunit